MVAAAVLLLTGCGRLAATVTPPPVPTPTVTNLATAQAQDTAAAAQVVASANAMATTVATVNAQAYADETATAAPLAMPTPVPAPTSTPVPKATPTASPPAARTVYAANFATWPTRTPTPQDQARVSYDPVQRDYVIALTDPKRAYFQTVWLPGNPTFQNFQLDVNVHQVAGPNDVEMGVVFDGQPARVGDKTAARYNLLAIPGRQLAGASYTNAANQGKLLGLAPAPMLKQGDATNHLQLTCRGSQLTIVINGQRAGEYPVNVTQPGYIGLTVDNPSDNPGPDGAAAAFSDLRIMPLGA